MTIGKCRQARLRWPRGRYNGARIVGVEIKARLDITDWGWRWRPRNGLCGRYGPLRVWLSLAYSFEDRSR
jgi:hypothetical protein